MGRGGSVQGWLLVGAVALLMAAPSTSWSGRKKTAAAGTSKKLELTTTDQGRYNREIIDKLIDWSQQKNTRFSSWSRMSALSCCVRVRGYPGLAVTIPHSVLLHRELAESLFPDVPLSPVLTADYDLMISVEDPPNEFSASKQNVAAAFRQMKAIAEGYQWASAHKGVPLLNYESFLNEVRAVLKAVEP